MPAQTPVSANDLQGHERSAFGSLESLPSRYKLPGQHISDFIQKWVDPSDGNFDWTGFKGAVEKLSSDQLSIEPEKSEKISPNADAFTKYFSETLHASLDDQALKARIKNAASFTASSSSSSDSVGYVVLFALEDGSPSKFRAVLVTYRFTSHFHSESSWWGLSTTESKDSAAEVTGARLLVDESFQLPGQP
ncbi:hypothetical protein FRC09_020313 [Ceratobasidium sp. 395]|nr:hypothetical protein FRC09_020313 [Ceratobasidium sp. 395]